MRIGIQENQKGWDLLKFETHAERFDILVSSDNREMLNVSKFLFLYLYFEESWKLVREIDEQIL